MINLKIITSTVRPGRKGPVITRWIEDVARKHGAFTVEVLDLAVINLPLMNEANHPRLKKYEHEHTRNWSASVEEADAFIFVTAEYDFNYPAPLRNAIEYLYHEWTYKAAGIVSYGGVSAGTRATNALKADLASMKVVPIPEYVNIPFFTQHINDEDEFLAPEMSTKAAEAMLTELVRWSKGLKLIRENRFE
jgi:NAD(P)H-dependent FMN reductase